MTSRIPATLWTEREVAARVAALMGWKFVDLERYQISCSVLRRIPGELACRLRAVPMLWSEARVLLVVDDAFTASYIEANQDLLGPPYRFQLEFAMATRAGVDAALRRRLCLVRD